ncbi:MAG: DUF2764 domain-containing protein [Alistipes sp.]|jgi:hypothetical protein|nr:DUF2764 domain-containing protein [Alistipes sp.]
MFGTKQYYNFVAGLKEYTPGYSEKGFDAGGVYGEVRRALGSADRQAAGLVWSLSDIYGLGRERIEQLYGMCARSKCAFVKEWARFDRNLRNVIAAHTARAKGREVAPSLLSIEGDEIPLTLARSSAADFNLRGELDYIDRLLTALGDTASVVEKERAIDLIRWEKADALAEGDTFGAPAILSYIIKVAIIGRWAALDPVTGREMYDKLVNSINKYDKR